MSAAKHPRRRQVANTQAGETEPLWPELVDNISKRRSRGLEQFSALQYTAIAKIIRRRFPGLEVRSLAPLDTVTVFAFRWLAERSVADGLVPKELIPPLPKRVFFGAELPIKPYGRRIRGGRIEANIRVPDDLSAGHPLAFLRPSAIRALAPSHDARSIAEWRESARGRLRRSFHSLLGFFLTDLEGGDAAAWFGWRPDELDDVREFIEETKRRFEPLLGSLRAEDRRRSVLSLVVDTTRDGTLQ